MPSCRSRSSAALFCATLLTALACGLPAQAQDLCRSSTGYEFRTSNPTRLRIDDSITNIDAGTCEPPTVRSGGLGGGGSAAVMDYTAGFGIDVSTEVFAGAPQATISESIFQGSLFLYFTVVPNDPMMTGPVTVTLTSRHTFGTVGTGTTGTGGSSNFHRTDFVIRRDHSFGQLVDQWNTAGILVNGGTTVDLVHDVDLDVDRLYSLFVFQRNTSNADRGPSHTGTGTARLDSVNTFEMTSAADVEIVFEHEALLGLGKPQIGVVPEPSAVVANGFALLALAVMRRVR